MVGSREAAQAPTVDSGYLGSAIGALEECERSQLDERQPHVKLLLGRAYSLLRMPLKTYEYWKEA